MGTNQEQPVDLGKLTFDVPHLSPTRRVADEAFLAENEELIVRLKKSGEYERLRAQEPVPTVPFRL